MKNSILDLHRAMLSNMHKSITLPEEMNLRQTEVVSVSVVKDTLDNPFMVLDRLLFD